MLKSNSIKLPENEPKVNMLTRRQKEIFDFISLFITKNGYSPSLEEIRQNFGLNSVATIHEHIETLYEKGYLKKESNQPRAITPYSSSEQIVEIPLLGLIAAGQPIEAIENPEPFLVNKQLISQTGNHYALRVQGNSMIEEGIFDGDVVVIREQKTADNGDTVVAIINGNEATVKKLYREENRIRLQPANQALLPIFTDEIEIRGKVVSIIRSLEKQKTHVAADKNSVQPYVRKTDYTWDYRGVNTKPYTHIFHQYPAMFIPQVARRLIQNYSKKGDTICDIFCGSGTALVEGRLLGRICIGIDLNPHAIFLARAKTHPINPNILQKVYFDIIENYHLIQSITIKPPRFFNIDYWFKPQVILDLAKLKKVIDEIENPLIKNFFLVSFSHVVRATSNTRGGEFKLFRLPPEKLKNHNPNVLQIFRKKTEENIRGMENLYRDIEKNTQVTLIEGDSTKNNTIPPESIDLVITSPPYGDSRTTVAYGQFSRLSMQWLHLVDDSRLQIDNEMLGGRPVKHLIQDLHSDLLKSTILAVADSDEKRAREVVSFFLDLEKAMYQAYLMLKKHKYFCVVIGNRTVKGIQIPTDFIISELAEKMGFIYRDIFVRNIPNKRMPKKNSPTNEVGKVSNTMNIESIVILQKIK